MDSIDLQDFSGYQEDPKGLRDFERPYLIPSLLGMAIAIAGFLLMIAEMEASHYHRGGKVTLLDKLWFRFERISNGFRLIGTLAVGLVIIDETVRLQIRGEAYRHLYLVNSFGTWDKTFGNLLVFVLVLLLLTPWYSFLSNIRKPKQG
jgi:hypothetical protein